MAVNRDSFYDTNRFNSSNVNVVSDDLKRIYFFGGFTSYNGITTNRIVRIKTDDTIDTSFNIGTGFNNTVSQIQNRNGKLYISGTFTQYNGTTITGGACVLNYNGTLDTSFSNVSGYNLGSVFDVDTNGNWYFNSGSAIYSLTSNGDFNTGFTSGSATAPECIYYYDNSIYVAGYFYTYNGVTKRSIAKVFLDGTLDTAFGFPRTTSNYTRYFTKSLYGYGDYLYVVGLDHVWKPTPPSSPTILWTGVYKCDKNTGAINHEFNVANAAYAQVAGCSGCDVGQQGFVAENRLWCLHANGNRFGDKDGQIVSKIGLFNLNGLVDRSIDFSYNVMNSSTTIDQTTRGGTFTLDSNNNLYVAGAGLTYDNSPTPNVYYVVKLLTTGYYFPTAPSDLTVTGITYTTATLNWVNNSTIGVNVIQRWTGSVWQNVATLSSSVDTYQLTGLTVNTIYTYRVSVLYNSVYYPSNSVTFTTLMPLPSFCENAPYTVSGSTCGNSDGSVTIDNVDYHIFYDFVLTDVQGNVQALTGLTSGYYFLTATVKPAYWYWYGRETCTFEWLEVIDSDTTMSNTSKSVRNVVCGGFGKQQGRIAYLCTDSGSNPIYTAKLYNKETRELVQTVTGTTIDLIIFSPLNAGDYYCHITNDAGCSLLIGATKVQGQSLRSVAGIKKLWLTQWDENVEYDYWAQSDDDYYLSGIDADFFNSIKIKRFIDSTLPDVWYSVNVQTKAITFSQTMEKTKQGFVFNDKLALTIPEADNTKWKELVDILQNRYILIFLDNNGYYWCMGYKHGASTDGYKRENNEYMLEFNAISENKILTNIDKQYIIDSIL